MKLFIAILLSTILTTYQKGVYYNEGHVDVQCSQVEANALLDSLIADFATDPSHLFQWAFYATGEQKDTRKNSFTISYDSVHYDVPAQLLTMNVTVYSPRGKADPMTIESVLSDSRRVNGLMPDTLGGVGYSSPRVIVFEVDYPGNLVKWCGAELTLQPSADTDPHAVGTQHLQLLTHCKFGWFFNLFIGRKMYRNTVEWRMEQFLENLRCTAEHQPLQQINIVLEK